MQLSRSGHTLGCERPCEKRARHEPEPLWHTLRPVAKPLGPLRSSRGQCHTVMRVCAPHVLAAGRVWSPSPVPCSSSRTAARVQTPSCCVTHCCQGLSSSWRGSSRRRQRSSRRPLALSVFALDAALPFDYEAQAKKRLEAERNAADKLVIGPSPSARSSLCPPSLTCGVKRRPRASLAVLRAQA